MIIIIVSISLLVGILGTVTLLILLGILDKTENDRPHLQQPCIPYDCPYRQTTEEENPEFPFICPYCKSEDTADSDSL